MNRHTFPLTDDHRQIQLLLPWYVNHSLEQNERKLVESHLRSCILCHRELVVLRKLAEDVNKSSVLDVAAEASFARLRGKLQAAEPVRSFINQQNPDLLKKSADATSGLSALTTNNTRRLLRFSGRTGKYLAIAASMLFAMIPLAMQYGRSPAITDYYTLSDGKPESLKGAQLRIVFSKSLPNTVIDSLLKKIHGKLVEGPNSVGAYTVRLGDGQDSTELTTAITFLRSQQNVMLVEPVIEP
ncbi:MAG: hypothetical protein WCP01_11725 [Methylococcaceae bacterium]